MMSGSRIPSMGMPQQPPNPEILKAVHDKAIKIGFLFGFAIGIIVIELIVHLWVIVPWK